MGYLLNKGLQMTKKISIYLAGKIQKAHEDSNETYWTEKDQKELKAALSSHQVHFLNPALRTDDLSDQKSVFGRDMIQVFSADFVFVDARDRRGLGVGAEMMWAKMNGIPVITWAPLNSHYHKESASLLGVEVKSWVHPFVVALSDKIVSSLQEASSWIFTVIDNPATFFKNSQSIYDAMNYYMDEQYRFDNPMKHLAEINQKLKERFHSVKNSTVC